MDFVDIRDERLVETRGIHFLVICKVYNRTTKDFGWMYSVRYNVNGPEEHMASGWAPEDPKYRCYGGTPAKNGSVEAGEADAQRLGMEKFREIMTRVNRRVLESLRE